MTNLKQQVVVAALTIGQQAKAIGLLNHLGQAAQGLLE